MDRNPSVYPSSGLRGSEFQLGNIDASPNDDDDIAFVTTPAGTVMEATAVKLLSITLYPLL